MTTTTEMPWLEAGQPVAIRHYGPGQDSVSIGYVDRFTKTRIVLKDGKWFNRATLRSPRQAGTWTGRWAVLEDPNDPHVVRDLARQNARRYTSRLDDAVRAGDYTRAIACVNALRRNLHILTQEEQA